MHYRPLNALATWTIALSIASWILLVIATAANTVASLTVSDWGDPDVLPQNAYEWSLLGTIMLAWVGLMLVATVAGVLFLIWFAIANANVPALGVMGKRFGAGWAVGWWLIPLANLVMPMFVLKEAYLGSKPGVAEVDVWRDRTPGIVAGWWGLWIASGLTSMGESIAAATGQVEVAAALGVATAGLSGVGLWLFVKWCLAITRWQQSKHDAGGAGLYACTNCGYDLRGTRGPFCPECGHEVPADIRAHLQRQGESGTPEPWQA